MDIGSIVRDLADALKSIADSRVPFKAFRPGVGPYGEPQLVKLVASHLHGFPTYGGRVKVRLTPDLLISVIWAVEIALAVKSQDVVSIQIEAADWWSPIWTTVRSMPIVVVQPGSEVSRSLLGILARDGIGAFSE